MKKAMFLLILVASIGFTASAQEKTTKDETKVKKTATVPQHVHNTFSRHKHYKGYKVKHVKEVEHKKVAHKH